MGPSHRSRRSHSKTRRMMRTYLPIALAVLVGGAAIGGGVYYLGRKSPEDHLKAGIEMQERGDLKGALIELKNALQGMPNNAQARFRLGQIQFEEGDYQGSEKELRKARELGLRDDRLDPLYARTLLAIREAKRLLDEVYPLESMSSDTRATVLALRARAHLMLDDPAACQESLREADAVLPDHPETLISRAYLALADSASGTLKPIDQPMIDVPKQATQALAYVDKAIAQVPDRVEFLLLKANLLHATKQRQPALQAYGQVLRKEPANDAALRARAQVYLELADLDRAEADLKTLLKHQPKDAYGRYLRAFIEFKRARPQEAEATLQEVLQVAPNFLSAHLLAGAVNIQLGNREAARNHLDKVLAAAPQQPLARKLMAATAADMGDLSKARELVNSLGSGDEDAFSHAIKGVIALRQGDYAEARKNLEQVTGTAASNVQYLTDLAASRLGSGDDRGAIAALNKAAELDVDNTQPDVLLVMTHLREKRPDEAMQVVNRLEKQRPRDPLVYNLRGAIHISQNDMPLARAAFSKALELQPDYFPAASNLALMDVKDKAPDAARGRFKKLLQHNPKEYRAWMALAAFDLQARDENAYLKDLEAAKKANEKAPQPRAQLVRYWLGKKDPAKALVEARAALDATGRVEFNELIGMAQSAQGDHANAVATFGKWSEANPSDPLAHFRLAQEQAANRDTAAALKTLDKVLALRADFVDAAILKAVLLGQTGRAAEGIKITRALQGKNPEQPAGYLAEADLLMQDRQFAEAGRLYAKGARLAGSGIPLVLAAQSLARVGQSAVGEKLLTDWLETRPNDAAVRHQLAQTLLGGKRLPQAAEQYRILARANPKDRVALNNLAWILGELGDKDALSVAEQAYKLDSGSANTLDTLGWILVNAGQTARGLDLIGQAAAKAPNALEIRWHLVVALAKAGKRQQARQELERLVNAGFAIPKDEKSRQLLDSLK